jgi:predicted DNA-binding transcriptional regulator AlpA
VTTHQPTLAARSAAHKPQKPLAAVLPTALSQFDSLPDAAHVRLPIVAGLNGISAPTVWRWVKTGRLPAPVKLGPNTTAWNVGALRAAIAK